MSPQHDLAPRGVLRFLNRSQIRGTPKRFLVPVRWRPFRHLAWCPAASVPGVPPEPPAPVSPPAEPPPVPGEPLAGVLLSHATSSRGCRKPRQSSVEVGYSSVHLSNGPKLSISVELPRPPAGFVPMAEAARALGVNRSTVYRLYEDGRLTVQLGARGLLVSKTEVAALLGRDISPGSSARVPSERQAAKV
jgi:excisionase family DNA binding protein